MGRRGRRRKYGTEKEDAFPPAMAYLEAYLGDLFTEQNLVHLRNHSSAGYLKFGRELEGLRGNTRAAEGKIVRQLLSLMTPDQVILEYKKHIEKEYETGKSDRGITYNDERRNEGGC